MPAPATLDTIIRHLRRDPGDWSDHTSIDYGFFTGSDDSCEAEGFVPMSAKQQVYAQLAFELWDDLIPLELNLAHWSSRTEINFAYSSATEGDGTYARPFYEDGDLAYAEIWLNSGWEDHNEDTDLFFGSYGFQTYLHEIGHTLGLSHPGPYDASDPGPETYAEDAVYAQDTLKYTAMSYFDANADGSGTNHGTWSGDDFVWRYSATPLLHDIAAIQAIYGVDTTTRTDDTVYGFNSNAGRTLGTGALTFYYNPYDFVQNPNPVFCIWDAGGNDTIDASRFTASQKINLNEGAFSSISASGIMTDNVSIAFGARIENAIGGSGNDEIRGNALDNMLQGRGGMDTLIAGAGPGRDTLYGGDGNDILMGSGGDSLWGGRDNDTYYVLAGDTVREELASHGTDTVHTSLATYTLSAYVENLIFSVGEHIPVIDHTAHGNSQNNEITGTAGVDTFYGNNGIDILWGREGNDRLFGGYHADFLFGEQGNDTLRGDTGNDTLVGGEGRDTLTGGADADTFRFDSTADSCQVWAGLFGIIDYVDTITDFVHGIDKIDLLRIDANAATAWANEGFRMLSKGGPVTTSDWTATLWIEQQRGILGTGDTTVVYASTDADPVAEFQVKLSGLVTLTSTDFWL